MNIKSNLYITAYSTQTKEIKFQLGFYLTNKIKDKLIAQGAVSADELADVSGVCVASGVTEKFIRKLQDAGLTRASEATVHFGGIAVESWTKEGRSGKSARIVGLFAVELNNQLIELEFSVDELIASAVKKAEASKQSNQSTMTIGA